MPLGAPSVSVPEPVIAPTPLLRPADGVPALVTDDARLRAAAGALAAGAGPIAVDAERASGYRYGQRAYLVQLRRAGTGTLLVDPVACPDLTVLDDALADGEWILHAASQDLPCLAERGMRPRELFDTELAGRLLGLPRVGLGPMIEALLGVSLQKGHSAADWSRRPLPENWLVYAALDVELLIDLRDVLEERLRAAGKLGWARQEFAAVRDAPTPAPRAEPWRRTSGIHRVHNRRRLAVIRELWTMRDEIARRRDIAPGRILPDAAIVSVAANPPEDAGALPATAGFGDRANRAIVERWWSAIARARQLPDAELPAVQTGSDGPPPVGRWAARDPQAAARLTAARTAVAGIAERVEMPTENVLSPDAVRRLAWRPPAPVTEAAVAQMLREYGARPWQVDLAAASLDAGLRGAEPAVTGG